MRHIHQHIIQPLGTSHSVLINAQNKTRDIILEHFDLRQWTQVKKKKYVAKCTTSDDHAVLLFEEQTVAKILREIFQAPRSRA